MTSTDPRWLRVQEFAQTAGNNPRRFAYVVTELVDDDIWREFERPPHRLEHYDDFDKFCQDYADLSASKVLEVCEVVDIEESNPHRRGLEKLRRLVLEATSVRITHQQPDTASRVIGRLKRDKSPLYDEVIAGNISPHAAAIQAGIRRPRASFLIDDVDDAVRALLRYYSVEDVAAAVKRADHHD